MFEENKGCNLADIMAIEPSFDELAWDHAMDLSASIYRRLSELGMSQKDLAETMGVSAGRISQIIKGEPGMSLKTLAKLEIALDFRVDAGFLYQHGAETASASSSTELPQKRGESNWQGALPLVKENRDDLTLVIGGLAA